jgi:hypothetical protein
MLNGSGSSDQRASAPMAFVEKNGHNAQDKPPDIAG